MGGAPVLARRAARPSTAKARTLRAPSRAGRHAASRARLARLLCGQGMGGLAPLAAPRQGRAARGPREDGRFPVWARPSPSGEGASTSAPAVAGEPQDAHACHTPARASPALGSWARPPPAHGHGRPPALRERGRCADVETAALSGHLGRGAQGGGAPPSAAPHGGGGDLVPGGCGGCRGG